MYIQDETDYFWYLDRTLFESIMSRLGRSGLDVTSFSDTHIRGSVNAEPGDRVMFTGIPYDEGWRVYIDGERVDLLETSDFLLAFELPEGQHTVELRYLPTCVIVGDILSAVGIVSLVAICLIARRRSRPEDGNTEGSTPANRSDSAAQSSKGQNDGTAGKAAERKKRTGRRKGIPLRDLTF